MSPRALVAAAALVCFSVGFYAGNRRASALERYLDQTVLENDGLRAVMAEQVYHLDRLTDTRDDGGEIERLRAQLDQANFSLADMRGAADAKSKDIEARDLVLATKDGALRECAGVQSRLEEQLEDCIFQRAALERRAGDARDVESRPRSGVSTITESITYPGSPE